MFERIHTIEGESTKRGIRVPQKIRDWADKQLKKDKRPFGEKVRLQDIYLALATAGADQKHEIVFDRKHNHRKMTEPGMLLDFPNTLYAKVNEIHQELKAGGLKKVESRFIIDRMNIIFSLMEAGIEVLTKKPE